MDLDHTYLQGLCGHDPLAKPKQPHELPAIETDDHFPVYDRHGGCPVAELQEFIKGCMVFLNVLVHEGNALLRKKLFLLVACPSPWLTVDDHFFGHQLSPFSLSSSGLWRRNPCSSSPTSMATMGPMRSKRRCDAAKQSARRRGGKRAEPFEEVKSA